MGDDIWKTFCENYEKKNIKDDYNIGYFDKSWPFLVISSTALTINIITIFTHTYKSLKLKYLKI
jgi:hypothetical protein